MKSLAEHLIDWAKGRPKWQRHVIARLAMGEALARSDYVQIARRLADDGHRWDSTAVPHDWAGLGATAGPVQLIELTIRGGGSTH